MAQAEIPWEERYQEMLRLIREGRRNAFFPAGTEIYTSEDEVVVLEYDVYICGDGHVVSHLHDPRVCHGRNCVIHNPSDHIMKDWPTHFRDPMVEHFSMGMKPGLMERICPHGTGHPDPDSADFWVNEVKMEDYGIHGCDGCCGEPSLNIPDALPEDFRA